jgi:hypothetical protein
MSSTPAAPSRTSPRKSTSTKTKHNAHQSTTKVTAQAGTSVVGKMDASKKRTVAVEGKVGEKKCHYKRCGIVDMEELECCAAVGCKKVLHPICMELMHAYKEWFEDLDREDHVVVCSKTCYDKHVAATMRKPNWKTDGANGPDDPKSSERILLDWLMTEGNYSNKWRGKDAKGKKKKHVAAEIATIINAAKVKVFRDGKQVMNKMSHIEKCFRMAHDFANTETGQGLQENDPGEFDEAVKGKCPYYFDLIEIFGDRASAKPKAMSNDNLDSSEGEEDEEEESSQDLDLFSLDDVDSGGDAHIDGAKYDSHQSDDGEDVEKHNNMNEKNNKGKRKNVPSSLVSVASSKKNKANITLFDHATTDSLAKLAATQQKVANTRLKQMKEDNESKMAALSAAAEQADLELRMKKFQMLHDIRERNPSLSNEQIIQMFPMLEDFVNILK